MPSVHRLADDYPQPNIESERLITPFLVCSVGFLRPCGIRASG